MTKASATVKSVLKQIPHCGLGTWKMPKETAADIVYQSVVDAGIRHIDCAGDYGNEYEVGLGIKRALNEGKVKREDLWITSKLWNTFHKKEHVQEGFDKSLHDLQLDYFDLYLVHWPISLKYVPVAERYPAKWVNNVKDNLMVLEPTPMQETWEGMEKLHKKKLAHNIGVSNFNVMLLSDLLSYAKVKPYVNQIEIHPLHSQVNIVDYCLKNDIQVSSYSPLGSLSYVEINLDSGVGQGLLKNPIILDIAERKSKSSAQIILRWHYQRGLSAISKSSHIERIKENHEILDFELSKDEMDKIFSLNRNKRFNDPAEFCKSKGGSYPLFD
mmetsp:Transcript_13644/g.12354  ORF Transcript_13644/g.12354 Transcript_13644/m.12354 type:complete len:328 (+) Transcript_13644:171-1154(+)